MYDEKCECIKGEAFVKTYIHPLLVIPNPLISFILYYIIYLLCA